MGEQSEWVSLGEAASILGVHPSTVRHWADNGDLPSQRTPGGHRRFRRTDLERWVVVRDAPSDNSSEAQIVLQNALGRTRLEVVEGHFKGQSWYEDMDYETRREHGRVGRRLLEVLSQYLTNDDDEETALQTIRELGTEYAQLTLKQDIALSQTVRAFIFFRDMMTESVIQMAEMLSLHTPSDWGHRLQQVNRITDEMLLSLITTYETQAE